MNRTQIIITTSALVLLLVLLFFGKTIPDKIASIDADASAATSSHPAAPLTLNDILNDAKQKLNAEQAQRIAQLENSVVRGDVQQQQIRVYQQLSRFWMDTMKQVALGAYYLGEAGKLGNSEKNLNFAARLLLDNLLAEEDNLQLQHWFATNVKALYEQSLKIDPANDSAKIGIGACYLFGNIADNPMQGIQLIREVAERDSNNMYAQMMLGLGGVKSGQLDKAVERFNTVVQHEPENVEAIFRLAETYDRKGDKANAVKWYKTARDMVTVPAAKQALDERINALNK